MFRPISMVVPDSTLIAEITLFGEGFNNCKVLPATSCGCVEWALVDVDLKACWRCRSFSRGVKYTRTQKHRKRLAHYYCFSLLLRIYIYVYRLNTIRNIAPVYSSDIQRGRIMTH